MKTTYQSLAQHKRTELATLHLMLDSKIPLSHLVYPQRPDFMFAAISTEELEGLNQLMIKQLKNRYANPSISRRFVVGIDRSKMRLYDVEQEAQSNVVVSVDDRPVMDNTDFGAGLKKEKFDKNVFDAWK